MKSEVDPVAKPCQLPRMTKSAAVIASSNFLAEVWTGEPPTISRLIELLDRLLVSYHDTGNSKAPYSELDPPERDWRADYDQAGKRFRDLGLYPVADPTEEGSGTLMMGDAVDDIADITADLRKTVWYAKNHGEEYANAYFRDFYFHWGRHARELLLLLHMKQAVHS